ncbi:MAG: hypothetical protein K2F82_08705 [Muribaculaceae bacterium]|nr:hypothetical protein [Muribaculaceae bacterium]
MKSPLLLAVAILSSTGVAAQHTIDITSGDPVSPATSTAPDRTVENLENGVRVTYTFSYARLDSIPSDSGNGAFIITSVATGKSRIIQQPKGESEAIIDLSDEASGTYVITMVVNGNKVDSSTISIN